VSMNRTIRPNSSHSSSHSVANTASNSQQKISHARYGYLNSRRASASAGGGVHHERHELLHHRLGFQTDESHDGRSFG
jgi:hypothetical protein